MEDNAGYRSGLQALLTESRPDIEVATAGSGQEALQWLESQWPALVLMDINLPDANGLELTRRIKAARGDGPWVVILTSYDFPEYRLAALDHGADAFLCKQSVSPGDLLALVEQVIPAS